MVKSLKEIAKALAILLAVFVLIFSLDKSVRRNVMAQFPGQIELPCPNPTAPLAGPLGQLYNASTGKYRQLFCVDTNGNITLQFSSPPGSTALALYPPGSTNINNAINLNPATGVTINNIPYLNGSTLYMPISQYTNSSTTFSNVSGLAFTANAFTSYSVHCNLQYNASATTLGIKIQWTGPASPAAVMYDISAFTNTSSTSNATALAFSTSLSANNVGTTANQSLALTLTLENGSNPGVVQLQAAATSAGTVGIIGGGSCVMQL